MKNLVVLLACISLIAYSCKKKELPDLPTEEEILTQKIHDIIPEQYLDTLDKYGLALYRDIEPPNVEGIYAIKPFILAESNIPTDFKGQSFDPVTISLSEQNNDNYGIKLIGKGFIGGADNHTESIATAISGKGNNFTIYGKVKSEVSTFAAIFAIVISGRKDGNNLRDIKIGIINIDNSNGGGIFIDEGLARIAYDSDQISERVQSIDASLSAPAGILPIHGSIIH